MSVERAWRAVRGLYAVTPDTADTDRLVAQVESAITGGARLIQYRNKAADPTLRLAQARALKAVCERLGAALVVNDHLDIALACEADGVHLGGDDGSIAQARAALGTGRLLGVSCYRSVELAVAAVRDGADHVAFGSFFLSRVKPGAVRAPVDLLAQAKRTLDVPVVAIGGITADNAPPLVAAGADALAVISAVFEATDVVAAAARFKTLFGEAA